MPKSLARSLVLVLALAIPAFAAAPVPAATVEQEPGEAASALLVAEVQRRLFAIGLYTGPDDGVLSPDTVFAIRVFQERNGLPVDGQVTPALMAALDAVGFQAEKLRERLAAVRTREAEEARVALAASPAAQALLEPGAMPVAVSPGEAVSCTEQPDAACVAALALAAAQQVTDQDRRDWLLADLVGLAAHGGDRLMARAALQGIADPRTVATLLGAIASIEQRRGETAQAEALVAAVPWAWARADAWLALAKGRHEGALAAATAEAAGIDDPVRRAGVLARIAETASSLQDTAAAQAAFQEARALAEALPPGEERDLALSHVAAAAAALGRAQDASDLALAIGDPWRRAPAVLAALGAAAEAAAWSLGAPLLEAVDEPRYAVLAHARWAAALAKAGRAGEATAALDAARTTLPDVTGDYAQVYAAAGIATAEIALGELDAAAATVSGMAPGRLKLDAVRSLVEAGGARVDLAAEARLIPNEVERLEALYELEAGPQADGASHWPAALVGEAASQADPWTRSRALARLARRMAGLP